jgi:lipid II:glycine glycyltransferase (peptidoglycan interpeptide bridge formation enzyme)
MYQENALEIEEERDFLNSAIEYFRSIGADMIIPATTNTIFRTYPDGAVAAPYGTYIIDLTQPEESLMGNLNSSHRRKLRLAMKQGVEIRNGLDEMNAAYELVRDTFKRSDMGFMDFDAFKRYVLSLQENVKIFAAYYQGAVQGCVVVPFSIHSAYYVYGGSIPEPHTGATNLLHWEAIRLFRSLGVKRYDFVGVRINPEEGSKQEGLMQYKQRFGGQFVQGYMWKYALKPLKFAAYAIAVRRLRGGDIVDQERHKIETVAS